MFVFFGTHLCIFDYKKNYSSRTNFQPLALNQTWMDTFLENNNVVMMSSMGLVTFVIVFGQRAWGCTFLFVYLKDILTQARVEKVFYNLKIQEFLFLAFFLISLFTCIFNPNGEQMVSEEVYK